MADEATDENSEQFNVAPMYANNVRLEASAWDLRMFFGQLVPSGQSEVDYHTDVAIPWAQAKLLHLYLEINIMLYERQNGRIAIPKTVMPSLLPTPPEAEDASNPDAVETFQQVQQKIKEFREREQGQ
jgi:hypothetical protein